MAQPSRKSSSRRKPAAPRPAKEDLFSEASRPPGDADDNGPKEEWSLDDKVSTEPTAIPAEPIAVPIRAAEALSAPPEEAIPVVTYLKQDPSPDPEDLLPEALPISFASSKASPHLYGAPGPDPAPEKGSDDPFAIEDELPAVTRPAHAPELTAPPTPVADPDFQPEATEDSPPGPTPETGNSPGPASRRNPKALIAAAAVLVALPALFIGILYSNRPTGENSTSRTEPRLPLAGKVATLPTIKSGWRTRQSGDLVSTVEITLPVPSRKPSELVPEVTFTLDPATTKTGFLRFIFLDPDGKISGDVRVLKVNGGTVEPLGSGAIVSGPTATVYGSLGFMDRPGFVAYATGSGTRWSVEISESTASSAREEEWSKLETFDLRNASSP